MSVTAPSDYIGKHELPVSVGNNKIQLYIDRYERVYLIKLFGCELYDSFVADPGTPRFSALLSASCEQEACGEILDNKGLKDMLLGFVYYNWTPDNNQKNTIAGPRVTFNENSKEPKPLADDIESRYNESVETLKALQAKMLADPTTYPEYQGANVAYSFFGGAF